MLIKDVYKKIDELKRNRRNFENIQEYCLGHLSEPNDNTHTEIYGALEDGANMNESLRDLASKTITIIDNEIERLNRIIENTDVKIN